MEPGAIERHRRYAETLRAAVTRASGKTPTSLRADVLARMSGRNSIAEPYDTLVRQIGDAAYLVTDAEVDAVRAATGSDQGAFEVIMSASIGAGLARWDAAVRAIEEASDAPA